MPSKRRIGKVKGRFCATSKKALRAFSCSQKIKCRPTKVGKALVAGKIKGVVYCCKRSSGRSHRVRHRRYRKMWVNPF